jgi:hypothetical protein
LATVRVKGGDETWQRPACQDIAGTGAITFTHDDGQTLAPTTEALRPVSYTMGLVALDTPNTLLAAVNNTILRSTDAGCSWNTIGTIRSDFPPTLMAASGGRAYGWADNRSVLFRVDQSTITNLHSPVSAITGLGVDPGDPDHVRLGDGHGMIHDSMDAGRTWRKMGFPPVTGEIALAYRAAFDPNNLDHLVVGSAVMGAFVSFNGGITWRSSRGFSRGSDRANVFNMIISPADSQIVWAMGLDLAEADVGLPSGGKHIYLSTDGGYNFIRVIDHSPDVTLVNGPVMAAHPTDSNILYFVFGTSFQNYGTDLFKYDAGTKSLTRTHNSYDDISAIEFSPADPLVIYLGLAEER